MLKKRLKFSLKGLKLLDPSKHFIDYGVLIPVLMLACFGVLMVYSASYYSAGIAYGNSFFFAGKQLGGLALGVCALIGCYFVNHKALCKLKIPALVVGFVFLLMVFIPGIGIESYGAKRWIGFGTFSFQASEIAKFCFVLFAAGYMAERKDDMGKIKGVLPVLMMGGLMCLLILAEPNLSITLCVGIVMLIMLFVGGMKLKHFAILSVPLAALVPVLIITEPYRLKRLMAFLDPWSSPQAEGFQLIQSLYSLGGGGWFGVGLFNSRQKYSFLPFSESDFIFSIIGEEFGLIGCGLLLLVFGMLIYSGYRIALNSSTRFGCYLATGITSIIAVQVLINVAVVTGSIPPTGLPLPFISAGSTSLVVFMAAVGVLLNIARQNKNTDPFLYPKQQFINLKKKAPRK